MFRNFPQVFFLCPQYNASQMSKYTCKLPWTSIQVSDLAGLQRVQAYTFVCLFVCFYLDSLKLFLQSSPHFLSSLPDVHWLQKWFPFAQQFLNSSHWRHYIPAFSYVHKVPLSSPRHSPRLPGHHYIVGFQIDSDVASMELHNLDYSSSILVSSYQCCDGIHWVLCSRLQVNWLYASFLQSLRNTHTYLLTTQSVLIRNLQIALP